MQTCNFVADWRPAVHTIAWDVLFAPA